MADEKVAFLVDRTDDARRSTPYTTFLAAAQDVQPGGEREHCDKALALFLTTKDGRFHVGFRNAGLRSSEMLALLECAKSMVLQDMGYIR